MIPRNGSAWIPLLLPLLLMSLPTKCKQAGLGKFSSLHQASVGCEPGRKGMWSLHSGLSGGVLMGIVLWQKWTSVLS